MNLDPVLLEILACPDDHAPLEVHEDDRELCVHLLRPGVPGARRHPGAAARRGPAPGCPARDGRGGRPGMSTALDESSWTTSAGWPRPDRAGCCGRWPRAGAQVRESMALAAEADVPAGLRRQPAAGGAGRGRPGPRTTSRSPGALADRPGLGRPGGPARGPGAAGVGRAADVLLVGHARTAAARPPAAGGGGGAARADRARAGPADSLLHEAGGRNRAAYVPLPPGRHPRATCGRCWSRCCSPPASSACMPARAGPARRRRRARRGGRARAARLGRRTSTRPSRWPSTWPSRPGGGRQHAGRRRGRAPAGRQPGRRRPPGRWGRCRSPATGSSGLLTAPTGAGPSDDLFRRPGGRPVPGRPRLVLVRAPARRRTWPPGRQVERAGRGLRPARRPGHRGGGRGRRRPGRPARLGVLALLDFTAASTRGASPRRRRGGPG